MERNDRVRQVVAAIVGIFVIVLLVLLARWTGDRIRERFLTPKTPAVVTKQAEPLIVASSEAETKTQIGLIAGQSTVSAIPATGPADFGYYLLSFLFLSGILVSKLAKRFS